MSLRSEQIFTADELERLERSHPDGLPAATVVELFRQRGVELAEATFRRYVQLGLLPRSRRVGRKGKHRGSHGLYPVSCLGRLAEVRGLMDAGLTLEEIQRSAMAHLFQIDALRRSARDIVVRLEDELPARSAGRATAVRRLRTLRGQVDALAEALEMATRELCPATPSASAAEDPAAVARAAVAVMKGRRPARTLSAARMSRTHADVSRQRRPGALS